MLLLVGAILSLTTATGSRALRGAKLQSFSAESPIQTVSPGAVQDVIDMLASMLASLDEEQINDDKFFHDTSCYYNTTIQAQNDIITNKTGDIGTIENDIETLEGQRSVAAGNVVTKKQEIEEVKETIASTYGIRQDQHDAFSENEANLVETITAIDAAVLVLRKHQESSLLHVPDASMRDIPTILKDQLQRHGDRLRNTLTLSQRKLVQAIASDSPAQPYASQSGQIYGILSTMSDQVKEDLNDARTEENNKTATFENLMSELNESLTTKITELATEKKTVADTDLEMAQKETDLRKSKEALAAARDALASAEEGLRVLSDGHRVRAQDRSDERSAVSEAHNILSSDDSGTSWARPTGPPGFFQQDSALHLSPRNEAAALLTSSATKFHHSADKVDQDDNAIDDLVKNIDEYILTLVGRQATESQHFDECKACQHRTQLAADQFEHDHAQNEAKKVATEAEEQKLIGEIAKLEEEIGATDDDIANVGVIRTRANSAFQVSVQSLETDLEELKQAKGKLMEYYGWKMPSSSSLITALGQATHATRATPGPGAFDARTRNEHSEVVIDMLSQIILDHEKLLAEEYRAEEDAQKAYESQVKALNKEKAASNTLKASLNVEKNNLEDVDTLTTTVDPDAACDCPHDLESFHVRRKATDDEILALRQVKAILRGADLSSS